MKTNSPFAKMLVLTLLLCAVPAFAQIEINDIDELQLIGNDPGYLLDGDYVLGNDIDASATAGWNSGAGFEPIGDDTTPFTGTFDGAGYVITNLTINRSLTEYVGLFGYTSDATLQNVALENMDIIGYSYVAGLVGRKDGGSITNCYSTGTVTGSNLYIGGLVGENHSGSTTSCYSTGTVSGVYWVGGLVGFNYGNTSNCYSTGAVTGDNIVGGFVGVNGSNITNCYSTGVVSGNNNVGGFIGDNGGYITNCFWDTETSLITISDGGDGKITAEMMQQATFTSWNFTNIWAICEGITYPWLQNIPASSPIAQPNVTVEQGASQSDPTDVPIIVFDVVFDTPVIDFDDGDLDFTGSTATITGATVTDTGDNMIYTVEVTPASAGTITVAIPAGILKICGVITNTASVSTDNSVTYCIYDFEINDIDELQRIGNDPCYPLDGNYVLGNDIDASATSSWNSGAGFAPIGDDTTPFTGAFDGAGYVITDLTINRSSTNYVGLFGYIDGATMQNIALENVDISGYDYVGGLTGYNSGSIIICYCAGTVSGNDYVGGLVGDNGGNITNGYSTNATTGAYYVGGLVGINGGDITNCYSTGAVSGNNYVGGFSGDNSGSITNCYWDTETSGMTISNGGEGKTTAEMIQQATFANWDFTAIWAICEGVAYPWLQSIPTPYPIVQPSVTVEEGTSQSDPTNAPLIVFDVVFDAPVTDFDDGDLDFTGSTATITGATVTDTGDNMTYTVEVIPGSEGTITVAIPAGVLEICGITTNTASVSTDNTVTYNDAPTVPIATWPAVLTLLAVGIVMARKRKK